MIQDLIIKNFQSHRLTKLEFHKGLNIIVGTSDSGKTAVLRALRLVTKNKPQGASFRSWWGGKTEVSIHVDDVQVTRSKDKIEEYQLGDSIFHAFKTDVPEEIATFLNLQDINVQSQMDMPFLLNESSGEVASYFNKVAGLDKIDLATANVNSAIRELNSDIKYKTAEKKEIEAKVEQFQYIDKLEIEVEVLEEMTSKYNNAVRKEQSLTILVTKIKALGVQIEWASEIFKIEKPLGVILVAIEKNEALAKKRVTLRRLIATITDTETEIEEANNTLRIEPILTKILKDTEKQKDIANKGLKLKSLIFQIKSTELTLHNENEILLVEKPVINILALIANNNNQLSAISALNKALLAVSNTNVALAKKQAEFKAFHKAFDLAMPDTCPLCGK